MIDVEWLLAFMREDVRRQHERLGRGESEPRDGRPTWKHVADRRVAILLSQVGDLSRFTYSDVAVEPSHRGYKTSAEEDSSFGHAFLQLLAVAAARGIDVAGGVESARRAIEERDWAGRVASAEPRGLVVTWPDGASFVEGVLVRGEPGGVINAGPARAGTMMRDRLVLLIPHATVEHTGMMMDHHVGAVVTEQGGSMCHAAIVMRERAHVSGSSKPVVVGSGPIMWPNGTRVRVHGDGRVERVGESS